jgi:hypothetical protein
MFNLIRLVIDSIARINNFLMTPVICVIVIALLFDITVVVVVLSMFLLLLRVYENLMNKRKSH